MSIEKTGVGRLKARVRREAYKRTRNQVDAQILAELWAWTPYAKTRRDGKTWVVKTDSDLIEDDGVAAAPRTIRAALRRLRDNGLIETTRGPHPNCRVANSRYIRLVDGLFEDLKACAESGRSRRGARRLEAADTAVSSRGTEPAQPGSIDRFHKQSTSKERDKRTDKKEERAPNGFYEKKRLREEVEVQSREKLEEIQKRFEEGCHELGVTAPALDSVNRVGALNRYVAACRTAGLTSGEMAEAAYLFAKHYSRDTLAEHLGKKSDEVSPGPNHFLLGMAADLAINLLGNGAPSVPSEVVQLYPGWFQTADS